MAVALPQVFEQATLHRIGRGKVGVAGFGGVAGVMPAFVRRHEREPQAGTCAGDGPHAARAGRRVIQRQHIVRSQCGHAGSLCLKVIDELHAGNGQRRPQGIGIQRPVEIGEGDAPRIQRTGQGEIEHIRAVRLIGLGHEVVQQCLARIEIRAGINLLETRRARPVPHPDQPAFGSPDIARDQLHT